MKSTPIVTLIHRAEKKWIRDIRRNLVSGTEFTRGVIYGLREAKKIVHGYYSLKVLSK